MPLIQVSVIKGVFSPGQKRQVISQLTDAMVSIEGAHFPGENDCSLRISGTRADVFAVSYRAVTIHGHADSPDFRHQLDSAIQPEHAS